MKTTALVLTTVIALIVASLPERVRAQTYPIDCAILLCLSGGWPASVPCARARAEFIRRITPWPVEPPLQIWRCPMGASFDREPNQDTPARLYDIVFGSSPPLPRQSFPAGRYAEQNHVGVIGHDPSQFTFGPTTPLSETNHRPVAVRPLPAVVRTSDNAPSPLPDGFAIYLTQDRADIDISGSEFNFVRSIRVYDVQARQYESGSDGDCNQYQSIRFGSYGTQGDYRWSRSSVAALPAAFVGLERFGSHCPSISVRAVFVDWRDYEGNYGWERVNY